MDILTSSLVCTTPRITGTETLDDLRALKRALVQEARDAGHLGACAIVAETLGERVTRRGWDTAAGYRWQLAGVSVELWRITGKYLPERQAFEQVTSVSVTVAGRMVVYYRESTAGREQPDCWFAPGPWLAVVYSVAARAQAIHDTQSEARREADRLALLDLLQNGKEL